VYRGSSTKDNREWAVKIIAKKKLSSTALQDMLKSEVAIMQKINHRNVMHLEEFLQSSTNYYLVMQVCNNGDVRKYMEKKGVKHLEEKEAVYFLQQIALGFKELHKFKVMHRDFKVDNLFMHDDTVIIADLGFAKAGREMTQTQCGTPMYMAPEVFEGKEYTNIADLWSVGVSMYELLFGKFPFNAMSQPALLKNIKENQGPNLEINRSTNNISKDCEDLLRSILTYDTNKRLSWEQFFNHPLFRDGQQKDNGGILNGTKSNKMMVTGMWDKAKYDHKNTNDFQQLKPTEDYQQQFQCDLQDIDETMREDDSVFNHMQKEVKLTDIFTHNSQRYEHELNKIRFVFVAVRKLKEFATTIAGHPKQQAVVLAYLCCAKKGLVFLNFN